VTDRVSGRDIGAVLSGGLEAEHGKPPKTPDNSSLPPSRGQKGNVAEPTRVKKARKGRPSAARALAENPDATRDIYAERCACGAALAEAGQELARAWDHVDLPPIKPITTRIHLFRATCPCCKARVTAQAPADMPEGSPFGPIVATGRLAGERTRRDPQRSASHRARAHRGGIKWIGVSNRFRCDCTLSIRPNGFTPVMIVGVAICLRGSSLPAVCSSGVLAPPPSPETSPNLTEDDPIMTIPPEREAQILKVLW
jgi:zinc-finger binding domain of transposase IS66